MLLIVTSKKILAGSLLHKVSNKLLMAIGAAGFTIAFLLVAVQRFGDSYWEFTFPALVLVVVGTDFEFNVVNVSSLRSIFFHKTFHTDMVISRCMWYLPCRNHNSQSPVLSFRQQSSLQL